MKDCDNELVTTCQSSAAKSTSFVRRVRSPETGPDVLVQLIGGSSTPLRTPATGASRSLKISPSPIPESAPRRQSARIDRPRQQLSRARSGNVLPSSSTSKNKWPAELPPLQRESPQRTFRQQITNSRRESNPSTSTPSNKIHPRRPGRRAIRSRGGLTSRWPKLQRKSRTGMPGNSTAPISPG